GEVTNLLRAARAARGSRGARVGRLKASCDSVQRLSLGAYVLGALDPIERAAVDAHLSGCTACREEPADLAAMPGLLSRVRVEDLLELERPPSPSATDRLIGRLRSVRRARRRRLGAAVAAAGLAAVAAVTIALTSGGSDVTRPTQNVASISAGNARTGVHAS